MSVLSKLTKENIRKNLKRSIVTMIGVALSSALIFTIIAIPVSYFESMKSYERAEYGDFHESFEYIPGDKVHIVEEAAGVESVYYAEPIKLTLETAYLEGSDQPIPAKLYTRLDSLTVEQRTPDQKFIVFVRYTKPKRNIRFGKDIGYALEDEGLTDITARKHTNLLRYDGDVDYNTTTVITCLGALVIGVVVIASIFTIRNSFNISTTERTHEFGMLSSLGATPRQIRRSVIIEALYIGVVAIPVGIVLGIAATLLLLLASNSLLGLEDIVMRFASPWWLYVAVIVLGLIIVWLASASAAIRASRLSPIEAIRSTQDIKVNPKKLKTNRFLASYFGVGGVIASKNLKRSRQKYRTTVISIVVSVAVFVGLSSFVIDSQRIVRAFIPDFGANYIVSGGSIEDYRAIVDKFHLNDYVIQRSVRTSGAISVISLSSNYFEKYAQSVGIRDDYEHAAILNNYIAETHSNGAQTVKRVLDYNAGDDFTLRMYIEEGEPETAELHLTISKLTDKRPMGLEAIEMPTIFISDNFYAKDQLYFDSYSDFLFANPGDASEGISAYLLEKMDVEAERHMFGLDIGSAREMADNLIMLAAIFMYGFIIVVALIGVTNIFNTIYTNIHLRAKEFAMLKSVGMTDQEFHRMIWLESILYTLRALLIGLPLGILISYGVHSLLVNGGVTLPYELPLIPIIIAVLVVALLISVIMHYSVRQVSRQNIIETIRKDTI